METLIPVENGDVLAALRSFFRKLLDNKVVDALYVPLEAKDGVIIPALVVDPETLDQANPLAPIMPINSARAVSALTNKRQSHNGSSPARLGVVLRPCELRALIELVKLKQASFEDVTVICIDCPGTYEMTEYLQKHSEGGFDLGEYLAAAREGREPEFAGLDLRHACQMCTQPVFDEASIHLALIGVDTQQGIPVKVDEEVAEKLQLPEASPITANRQSTLAQLIARHAQRREKEIAEVRSLMTSNGGIAGLFASCIRCHNCMTACPICYCKTCLFKTAAFDHDPDYYLTAARRKGAVRMLSDALLFHMTRLNHMSASCVSCGMCTSACPADIPVGSIFTAVGSQVQAAFDYVPGRNVDESLPLITFQANEWVEIGEGK
jgi:formate dehydrogenase subunit beta